MPRTAWTLALALSATHAATAAPVPPPRLVTAEAVIRPMRVSPQDFAARVVSATFLDGVAKAAGVKGGLRWGDYPVPWLAARLTATVDADRGTVTLRLADCPRRDAVALLSAVVEAYKAGLQASRSAVDKETVVWNLGGRQVQRQVILFNEMHYNVGPSKAEVDASVLQAPRVVPPGSPGKGVPASPPSR